MRAGPSLRAGGEGRLALFTDVYELSMLRAYHRSGKADQRAAFDLFFRSLPFGGGYAIAAGLERAVGYLTGLRFSEDDLAFLSRIPGFDDPEFLAALGGFRFSGDVYAVPEGTAVFPNEPLLRVEARLFEAQLLETALLCMVGYQSLIATKAQRIAAAAEGRPVLEFGSRRAHEVDAGLWGARAAVIGGCAASSNMLACRRFGLSPSGTQAHSWIMSYESELEAFRSFAAVFPDNLTLLVDTYDVLQSGLPNAMRVFAEVIARHGRPASYGIRLDSGDLAYLSRECRQRLDEAGFDDARVVASGDLDEYLIRDLLVQGARIDAFGVGTRLITAYDQPALGCVYKLAAVERDGRWQPCLKRSEEPAKVTNPGRKKVVRFIGEATGLAVVDLIMLEDEPLPGQPFVAFDEAHTWKRKTVQDARPVELLRPVLRHGSLVGELPDLAAIVAHRRSSMRALSPEHTRLASPYEYHVDLSPRLRELKLRLLEELGAAAPQRA